MNVFLSFLGLGKTERANKAIVSSAYQPTKYRFDGECAEGTTPYVQWAILHGLARLGCAPDLMIIALTRDSRQWQWDGEGHLESQIRGLPKGARPKQIVELDISSALDVATQWRTFQGILSKVPHESRLYVDLTHGFRAMPILFSTAISFLTQVKSVRLEGAYYGAYDGQTDGVTDIVNMKDFFVINRWADAVRSVVEDANPTLMAELAEADGSLEFRGLQDPELIDGFQRLGFVLKTADTTRVAEIAQQVVAAVVRAREEANEASGLLLELALEKFQQLARVGGSRRFTSDWYEVQLQMAKVLLDHELAMQGLTVLRELVVSWGEEIALRALHDPANPGRVAYLKTHKLRDFRKRWLKGARTRAAELFFARLHLAEADWDPSRHASKASGELVRGLLDPDFVPSFLPRKQAGRFEFLTELGKLRNTLNHAWTSEQALEYSEVEAQARCHYERVAGLTRELISEGVLGQGESEE